MSADFWAGYLSGAASIVVGNPLDLLKVRLQASENLQRANRPNWKSFRALAAGLPAPILTYGALNALLFTTYNRSLLYLPYEDVPTGHQESPSSPLYSHFLAGAVAGLATFLISTPTEYVKCRAQVAEAGSAPASSLGIATETLRQRGLRGFFLGGTVTSLRDAIGYGFWFATYEGSRSVWESFRSERANLINHAQSSDALKTLLCGGLAGVATWASVFPLDVIKTRVQTQRLPAVASGGSRAPSAATPLISQQAPHVGGGIAIAKEAYLHEGLGVFWRGLGVCCLRAFIVNAVQWSVYEWAMASLED